MKDTGILLHRPSVPTGKSRKALHLHVNFSSVYMPSEAVHAVLVGVERLSGPQDDVRIVGSGPKLCPNWSRAGTKSLTHSQVLKDGHVVIARSSEVHTMLIPTTDLMIWQMEKFPSSTTVLDDHAAPAPYFWPIRRY